MLELVVKMPLYQPAPHFTATPIQPEPDIRKAAERVMKIGCSARREELLRMFRAGEAAPEGGARPVLAVRHMGPEAGWPSAGPWTVDSLPAGIWAAEADLIGGLF